MNEGQQSPHSSNPTPPPSSPASPPLPEASTTPFTGGNPVVEQQHTPPEKRARTAPRCPLPPPSPPFTLSYPYIRRQTCFRLGISAISSKFPRNFPKETHIASTAPASISATSIQLGLSQRMMTPPFLSRKIDFTTKSTSPYPPPLSTPPLPPRPARLLPPPPASSVGPIDSDQTKPSVVL